MGLGHRRALIGADRTSRLDEHQRQNRRENSSRLTRRGAAGAGCAKMLLFTVTILLCIMGNQMVVQLYEYAYHNHNHNGDHQSNEQLGIGGGGGSDGKDGAVVSRTATNDENKNKTEIEIEIKIKIKNEIKDEIENKANNKGGANNDKKWKWFDGDLNAYYNSLETQIHDRDPSKIASYAVHRWMGPKGSTEEHYELIDRAVAQHHATVRKLKVFDAGCGLGSALMFFEKRHPNWDMTGHTISEEQHRFAETKLPKHNFQVNLRSYDEIDAIDSNSGNGDSKTISYDVIYSIEALIHSPNVTHTMKEWVDHLEPGGIVVIIDDFISDGVDKHHHDIQAFSKSWLANVLITPTELEELARNVLGLTVVENLDLLAEYEIVKRNYHNKKPVIKPVADRNHQGWMGSKWRQRLTVEGKLSYNMIVLKKDRERRSLETTRRCCDDGR